MAMSTKQINLILVTLTCLVVFIALLLLLIHLVKRCILQQRDAGNRRRGSTGLATPCRVDKRRLNQFVQGVKWCSTKIPEEKRGAKRKAGLSVDSDANRSWYIYSEV